MSMLTALLGSLRELFPKTYLLTGLVPAALLVFGWDWAVDGALAKRVFNDAESEAWKAAQAALLVAGIGLVFYALRQWLVHFYQALPGAGPLRRALVFWQLRRRDAMRRRCQKLTWDYTAVTWPDRHFRAEEGPVPHGGDSRHVAGAIDRSKRGRAAVQQSDGATPSGRCYRRIVAGLRAIYTLARGDIRDGPIDGEIGKWKALFGEAAPRYVIEATARSVKRQWAEVYRVFDAAYPSGPEWIHPTRLGNRFAALDDYAEERYGITTSTLWTRLWGSLDEQARAPVAAAQLQLYMLVTLSAASLICAITVLLSAIEPTLAALGAPDARPAYRVIATMIGALIGAGVFYGAAVFAFDSLAEEIKRLVDLQRHELISALGYSVPRSPRLERKLMRALGEFFDSGTPLDAWLRRPSAEKEPLPAVSLPAMSARQIMIGLSDLGGEPFARSAPEKFVVVKALRWMREEDSEDVLVLGPDDKPRMLVTAEALKLFLHHQELIGTGPERQLSDLTLADLGRMAPDLYRSLEAGFVTLGPDASLADVNEAMVARPHCVDAVVTEDGERSSRALGRIKNVTLAMSVRRATKSRRAVERESW